MAHPLLEQSSLVCEMAEIGLEPGSGSLIYPRFRAFWATRMPRKSAAELASGRSLGGITTRLRPPLSLQGPAREVFLRTVSTCRPDHFQAVDLPLLIQFSTATVLAAEATQQLADEGAVIDTDKGRRPSPWLPVRAQAAKELVQLSARLRICPQSRQANNPTRPSTAAPTANYLELMALREADDDDEVGPQ